MRLIRIPLTFLLLACAIQAASFKAGAARIDITPEGPIWLSGYANRNKPSEGVLIPLWAKALALEDSRGERIVIVTTDLLGLPRALTDVVGARVEKQFGLGRSHLLLNSSHTHTGPLIRSALTLMADLDPHQESVVNNYTQRLTDHLVSVIGSALSGMKPATVFYGTGSAGFAVNRREHTPEGVKIGVNPNGPVDHSVPVLKVAGADGKLIAVLFGYSCHNTTLTGEHYKISGDYAGFAQAELEKSLDGVTAMFLQLCAGDQNPNPRSTEQYAHQHGHELAAAVKRVLDGKMDTLRGRFAATLQWKELPMAPHSRDDFEKMLSDKDKFRVRFAKAVLRAYDERRPLRAVPYPVQAFRLADNLVLVALGGEVVVEYALNIKAAHPKMRLIVAGYSNDVMGYIPTAKMLGEGGYEPVGSTIYYVQAAPFSPAIEKTILDAADAAIRRVKP